MPEPLGPIDTRPLFRPVSSGLVALLRQLPAQAWERPTIAGAWRVRDVVAHLLDTTLRRLAFHRDGMTPPPPPRPITSERDFVAFINELNARWVTASERLSPRLLTDLYQRASGDAADWFEALPLDAPALFPVSWAGEEASAGWFDLGREFTELWHHQAQIRMAVEASPLPDPRFLAARVPRRPGRARRGDRAGDRGRQRRALDAVPRGGALEALARRGGRASGARPPARRDGVAAPVQRAEGS
jgi:hypothetical protein